MFYEERQLILENIDLINEIVPFLSDSTSDREDAEDFIIHNQVEEYNETKITPLVTKNFIQKQKDRDTLSTSLVQQWTRTVERFRDALSERVNPFGTHFTGIEIHKPSHELQKILYDLKLYKQGTGIDEKVRKFASFYYNRLSKKSRDIVADLLVIDTEPNDSKPKKPKNKKSKNKNKNKRTKKNQTKSKESSEFREPLENEDDYDIDDFTTNQVESDPVSYEVPISEINQAIEKKKGGEKDTPPEVKVHQQKNKEIMELEDDEAVPVTKDDGVRDNQTAKKSELSVEEYNRNIESLNNELFVKVDDLVLSNSDGNSPKNSDSNTNKGEDFDKDGHTEEKKLEDLNNSEEFIQEIRSEGGKEDHHKLEKESNNSNKYTEEVKNLRNSDKGSSSSKNNKYKNNKKQNSAKKKQDKLVKLEELKQPSYSKHPGSDFADHYPAPTAREPDTIQKQLSYTSEVKSTRSDDKNSRPKNVHSTNPTSETSSFKDSSVASHQDAVNQENPKKKGKSQTGESWIQTDKKLKKPKEQKRKKPLKSDRPKYQKPHQQEDPRRGTNKSNSPSDSIWNQESVQAMFSPQEQKAQKKGKKLHKKLKATNSVPKPETESQRSARSSKQEPTEKKKKLRQFTEQEKEEMKLSLNSRPNSFDDNKANFFSSQQIEEQKEVVPLPADPVNKKQRSENKNIGFHKNRRFHNEMAQNSGIPDEAVSSFYQVEDDYYNPRPFSKHKSQNYSYSHEINQYSNHSDYDYQNYQRNMYASDEQSYSDDSGLYSHEIPNNIARNIPNPTQSILDSRQFECEKILYETLSSEIEQLSEEITQQVDMIKDYRYDIKHQLEQITIDMFGKSHYNVQAHIYGSVATGLALPESDMDIVITGISSFGNIDTHVDNLTSLYQKIVESFSTKILVSHLNIPNTQVPIIKLKFDLSEYYDDRMKYDQSALPYVNFDSIEAINPKLKVLAVDISICDSFEGKEHQGIRAAYFVESKLIEYPILKPVCLILKKLLVKHEGYNDPYTGGLGSFSLFLMLYAAYFIEKINTFESFHNEATHPARLFTWFLTYFGEYFDMDTMAIMFMQEAMPLVVLKAYCGLTFDPERKTLCVLDPFNPKNNTTQKAFRIEQVCKLFSETMQKIFKEYISIYNSPNMDAEISILDKIL